MNKRHATVLATTFLCCLLLGIGVVAQGMPIIDWWVMGSGGGATSGGNVTMGSTMGQPIVGSASAGSISLKAGYSPNSGPEIEHKIYLPLVVRVW
jgi:hypothetical protein